MKALFIIVLISIAGLILFSMTSCEVKYKPRTYTSEVQVHDGVKYRVWFNKQGEMKASAAIPVYAPNEIQAFQEQKIIELTERLKQLKTK